MCPIGCHEWVCVGDLQDSPHAYDSLEGLMGFRKTAVLMVMVYFEWILVNISK